LGSSVPGSSAPGGQLWNHNIHYFGLVEKIARRRPRANAIDVGTGDGMLAARLHAFIPTVVGLDSSRHQVDVSAERYAAPPGLSFQHGDLLDATVEGAPFDFVVCSATIHHMDLALRLDRLRELTAPGGTLVVIGLGRKSTPGERVLAFASLFVSRFMRARHGWYDHGAPMEEPHQTYSEIERTAAHILPGADFRRRLYWRYSIVWNKPAN
jgi:2-polyprenyl-3-methyl-5-hydroxy-6-metoxy-1,4-benzoquinol methylase